MPAPPHPKGHHPKDPAPNGNPYHFTGFRTGSRKERREYWKKFLRDATHDPIRFLGETAPILPRHYKRAKVRLFQRLAALGWMPQPES